MSTRARGGVHTKLARISQTTFTITCCDDVMTADDGSLLVVDDELFPHGLRVVLTLPAGPPPDPGRAAREPLAVTTS
jgi:hypothetical protein